MSQTQFIVFTPDQLNELEIRITSRIGEIIKNTQRQEIQSKEWLTGKEVCTQLKISHTTLHAWAIQGRITKHKIGSRVRFRNDQVQAALTQLEAKRNRI